MSRDLNVNFRHSRWLELRYKPAGMLAFMLHRLSGIGLVFYLYLHLAVLNKLRSGPGSWDTFLTLMRSPLFLILDGLLLFGILIHGLNGLRLMLIGLNIGLRWQKASFWALLGFSLLMTLWGSTLLWFR